MSIAVPRTSALTKAPAAFRVVDEGSLRSDLARRREIKFLMRGADLNKLRKLLAHNCRRQVFNSHISHVRSIYYDDARLSACHANLIGLGRRRKLRLRWYDQLRPDQDFYFEIKWRENQVTGKHRVQLHSPEPLESLTYQQIFNGLASSLSEKYLRDLMVYYEPTLIVEYQREHFVSDDGMRLTLDYELGFYDQTGRQSINTSFRCSSESFVLLEAKVPCGRESELVRLLHPFSPRAGSCSKYVEGCRRVGLVGLHVA